MDILGLNFSAIFALVGVGKENRSIAGTLTTYFEEEKFFRFLS